ncbi:signal peptidase I [Sphingomonas flavalba]|uniref:signal peptidase I n=1 Tax=Sphingomonas flavalba TaxID=2559804 RepID=UPI001EF13C85|nr:signal peptidase I [Sphingomonas flavalba]
MRDFLYFLVKLALVVFVVRSFVVAPFTIPSESMQPRLLIGDYLLAAKWPYGYSRYSLPFDVPLLPRRVLAAQPERGDVVIFRAPPSNQRDYIKRVIGLPGDSVQLRGGRVILNGRRLPRERIADLVVPASPNSPCFSTLYSEPAAGGGGACRYPRYRETLPGGRSYETLDIGVTGVDDTPVFNVPVGHMFVMGDNRDRSEDSRVATDAGGIGLVPQDNLVGRALVVVYSTDGSASPVRPWTWWPAVRAERIGGRF